MPILLAVLTKFGLYVTALLASGFVLNAVAFSWVRTKFAWRGWACALAALALGFAALSFSTRAIALTGEISGMLDVGMLELLWRTPVGDVLLLRVIGLGVLAIGLWLPKVGLPLAALGVALTLWSFADIGHLSEATVWAKGLLFLHLAVAAFWVGILIPLKQMSLQSSLESWPPY